VIRFAQHVSPDLPQKAASFFLKVHLIGFMIGRFSGSYLMKRIAAPLLLCLALVLSGSGAAALWGSRIDWFFSFDYVPHNFCPQHQASWPSDKIGIFIAGGFNCWWGVFSRDYGLNFRP
jgi:hypothetical protein